MKSIKAKLGVVAGLLLMSSLAQAFEANLLPDATSSATLKPVPLMAYKYAAAENQSFHFVDSISSSLNVKFFNVEDLHMTKSGSNIFFRNDHAFFSVNAQMPAVNGTLGLVRAVFQTPPDAGGSVTQWAQLLSLAARQKITGSFVYSEKTDKFSSFDSVITYRLHSATDSGRADVVAGVRYVSKF